jgi:large subunit ribosomal protein L17
MRHQKAGRKLGRESSHRVSMLRNMVTSFFGDERIETTDAKAKELQKLVEKMITLGKQGNLHARRYALAVIKDRKIVKKLFEDIAPRFQDRQGGYTRIFKAGYRPGDGALLNVIELTTKTSSDGKRKAETKEKASISKSVYKKKGPSKTSSPKGEKGKKISREKGPKEGKETK